MAASLELEIRKEINMEWFKTRAEFIREYYKTQSEAIEECFELLGADRFSIDGNEWFSVSECNVLDNLKGKMIFLFFGKSKSKNNQHVSFIEEFPFYVRYN